MFLCFKEFELPKFIFGHFAFSARYILGTSISANHVSGIVKTYFYAFDIFMQTIFMFCGKSKIWAKRKAGKLGIVYDIRIRPDVIIHWL